METKTIDLNNIKEHIKFLFILTVLVIVTIIPSGCKKDDVPEKSVPFERLLTNQTYYSKLLHRDMSYAVLLPSDYDSTIDSYPVVYLLHGYGDDETAWYTGGNIKFYVNQYSGEIGPMIYVMPEAFNTYYVNKYNGNYPIMDVFVDELVPTIDSLFRTKADKLHRAVMGYSMGGYGAMILPVMNPETFSVGISLSMSFRTDEQYIAESQDAFNTQWAPIFGGSGTSGESRLTDYFLQHSPFHFFSAATASQYADLKLFFDCGDDEVSLSKTNDSLHCLLRTAGINHQYRVRNGAHTWSYWYGALHEALVYINDAMNGIDYPANPESAVESPQIQNSSFSAFKIENSGSEMNIMLPPGYEGSSESYPVIYILNDTITSNRNNCVISIFSILHNAMLSGSLVKSLVVEMAAPSSGGESMLTSALSQVDGSFRTLSSSGRRVLIANNLAGAIVSDLGETSVSLFDSFFLFDADNNGSNQKVYTPVFYYLDITDNGKNYASYYGLNLKLREENIDTEYRVRHGSASYQSFINGVSSSLYYLNKRLKE
jgi:enterochelin esterase-like enzyme